MLIRAKTLVHSTVRRGRRHDTGLGRASTRYSWVGEASPGCIVLRARIRYLLARLDSRSARLRVHVPIHPVRTGPGCARRHLVLECIGPRVGGQDRPLARCAAAVHYCNWATSPVGRRAERGLWSGWGNDLPIYDFRRTGWLHPLAGIANAGCWAGRGTGLARICATWSGGRLYTDRCHSRAGCPLGVLALPAGDYRPSVPTRVHLACAVGASRPPDAGRHRAHGILLHLGLQRHAERPTVHAPP